MNSYSISHSISTAKEITCTKQLKRELLVLCTQLNPTQPNPFFLEGKFIFSIHLYKTVSLSTDFCYPLGWVGFYVKVFYLKISYMKVFFEVFNLNVFFVKVFYLIVFLVSIETNEFNVPPFFALLTKQIPLLAFVCHYTNPTQPKGLQNWVE